MEYPIKNYPFLRFYPDLRLVTWHPTEILDDRLLDEVMTMMRKMESTHSESFNRFSNLSEAVDIKVKFGHAFQLAHERREFYTGPRVKSVLFSSRLVGLGMARMWESLMQDGPVDVKVASSIEDAAAFLEVSEDVLLPPS